MEPIHGLQLETTSLSNLQAVADLEYYDGPLLSLYKAPNEDHYLYYWCDVDTQYNRWLAFRVTDTVLNAYVNRKISLRHLIHNPIDGFVYVVDLDDEWNYEHVYVTRPKDLPETYYPKSDTYHESNAELDENISKNVLHTDQHDVAVAV